MRSAGDIAYLGNDGRVVAWTTDFRSGIDFEGGSIPGPDAFGIDPGGEYFFVTRGDTTTIASFPHPQQGLISTALRGERLFRKGDRLYLFGHEKAVSENKVCEVYRLSGDTVAREDRMTIVRPTAAPSPFNVIDLDPWSDSVLLLDSRDDADSEWLVYDLRTGGMTSIGRAKTYGFFLSGDVRNREPRALGTHGTDAMTPAPRG